MELYLGTALEDAAAAPAAPPALRYAAALSAGGVSTFVENVGVEVGALVDDGTAMPVTIGADISEQSYVASLYATYVDAAVHELRRPDNSPLLRALAPAVRLGGGALRSAQIDRTVEVENWLLPTGPDPVLDAGSLGRVLEFLLDRFPDHFIAVRGVNRVHQPALFESLSQAGFDLLPARPIYLLDPTGSDWRGPRNIRRDLKRIGNLPGYSPVTDSDFDDRDYALMAALYRMVYIDRHNDLSPWFTEAFFRLCHGERIFRFRGLRADDGRLAGFFAFADQGRVLVPVVVGYDTVLGRSAPIYRTLFAMYVETAREENKPLNLGYGVGQFKRLRGARPAIDYHAIYCRHLPPRRRLVVAALRRAFDALGPSLASRLGD